MSIPLILASQSRPRRDVLFSAGICPTIRVSHVDEPAALEREAAALGVTVNDLSVEQRVMILATAKAEAVHQAYRNIADTAAHARGERVVGFPLRAADDRDASSAGTARSPPTRRRPAISPASPFPPSPSRSPISWMAVQA